MGASLTRGVVTFVLVAATLKTLDAIITIYVYRLL